MARSDSSIRRAAFAGSSASQIGHGNSRHSAACSHRTTDNDNFGTSLDVLFWLLFAQVFALAESAALSSTLCGTGNDAMAIAATKILFMLVNLSHELKRI